MGKTVLFTRCLEISGLRSLVLFPSERLLVQTVERLAQFAPGLEYGVFWRDRRELDAKVVLSTYQTTLADHLGRKLLRGTDFEMGILDEAHEAIGQETRRALRKFFMRAPIIGFSATPAYSEAHNLGLYYDREICRVSFPEAVSLGAVAPTRGIIVDVSGESLGAISRSGKDYKPGEFSVALRRSSFLNAVVKVQCELFRGKRAMAFCADVAHAREQKERFLAAGIAAEVIDGDDSPTRRDEIVAKLRSGEIEVLCNAKLLTRGFDEYALEVAHNTWPTRSPALEMQRSTRATRLDPMRPDRFKYVVDYLYRDDRGDLDCVTFPQVAGGAILGPARWKIDDMMNRDAFAAKRVQTLEGNVRVILEPELILELSKQRAASVQYAPPEWVTTQDLHLETHRSWRWLAKRLHQIARLNPNETGLFANPQGFVFRHYSPQIADQVRALAAQDRKAPKGWHTAGTVAGRTGAGVHTVRRRLEITLRALKQEPRRYRAGNGTPRNFYPPEAVRSVVAALAKRAPRANGWLTATELAQSCERSTKWVSTRVQKLKRQGKCPTKLLPLPHSGRVCAHFGPRVLARLKTLAAQEQGPPQGWRTAWAMAKELECSQKWLAARLPDLIRTNPSMSKRFAHPERRGVLTFYHPTILRKLIKERQEARAR
jgi:hypothetical protein